jgi:hypothetical protein
LPEVERAPDSVIVKVGEPPDWTSIDVLDAPFVSLSTNALAVPALVKVSEVELANPLAKVKPMLRPVVVVIVLPVS